MKNAVTKWAEKNGYTFRPFYNNEKQAGILIDTDYYGPYPPASVYNEHDKIRRYCAKTGHRCESVAMHTGIRVYF